MESPQSVLDMVSAFEAQPLSSFGDASLKALANGIYGQGFSDGVGSVSSLSAAQVIADLQALEASENAEIQALIAKYNPPAQSQAV